jgi:protein-disulfide isomerase
MTLSGFSITRKIMTSHFFIVNYGLDNLKQKEKKMKKITLLALFVISLLITTGCTDKETLKNIQDTQKEILANKETMEEIQKTQKEILAKLADIEKKISATQAPSRPESIPPVRPTIDYNKVHNLPIGRSPIKGNKNALVTIVEFSDFQCPYCATLQPTLNEVLKAYQKEVKLVYKHFPLPFHAQAMNAAKASMAAGEQGKFWEMHDVIFGNYNQLSDEKFKELAANIGLDVKRFTADYNSNKYDLQIQQDINLARGVGVTGTPTLFINGKRLMRRSFNDFKYAIDTILKEMGT